MNYSSTHPAQRQIKKEEENISNYKNPIRSSRSAEKKKRFSSPHSAFISFFERLRSPEFWEAMAEIGHILELSELVKNFSVSGSPLDVISECYTYTVGGYFVSVFFFLVFTTHKHLRIALLFSYSFIDLKKSTKKFAYKSYFFHDSRTAVTLRSSHPASQRGVSGMFLSLFSFYLFIPPGGYLSRKEGDGRI